jgi:hypothetical protein
MNSFAHRGLLALAIQVTITTLAFADPDTACKLFSKSDMEGDTIELTPQDTGTAGASFEAAWNGDAGSIWLKNGFVLETYENNRYLGSMTTWGKVQRGGEFRDTDGGSYVNIRDFSPQVKIGSYRCRALGSPLVRPAIAPFAKLHLFNDTKFMWRSAGNHPDHKWVEIRQVEGQRILSVHMDDTYGTHFMNVVLDLDSGEMRVDEMGGGGSRMTMLLPWPKDGTPLEEKLAYRGGLWEMVDVVSVVASKNDIGFFLFPPKPELEEVEAFLKMLLRVQMR